MPFMLYQGAANPAAVLPKLAAPGFTDTFTRADSPTLGVTEDGKLWELFGASGVAFGVQSNEAALTSTTDQSYAVVDALVSNGTFEVTLGSVVEPNPGIVFRFQDQSNHLYLSTTPGSLTLYQRVGGTATELKRATASPNGYAPGVVLQVVLDGDHIQVLRDGLPRIDVVASTFQENTKHGLFGRGTTEVRRAFRWASAKFVP